MRYTPGQTEITTTRVFSQSRTTAAFRSISNGESQLVAKVNDHQSVGCITIPIEQVKLCNNGLWESIEPKMKENVVIIQLSWKSIKIQ